MPKRTSRRTRSKRGNRTRYSRRRCALGSDGPGAVDGSCLTASALHKLRAAWNTRHPASQITSTVPATIWQNLKERLGSACKSEACWLRQEFANHKLPSEVMMYTFAPPQPRTWVKKPSAWLTSDDINAVMKQAEHIHPEFSFFGPSPIDFDSRVEFGQCVWNDICSIAIEDQRLSGSTNLGFIFNTDPHYKGGEHWIAMYVNIDTGEITYLDSYGDPPPEEIRRLVERLKNQLAAAAIAPVVRYVNKRHQLGNSECGMYCLHFIVSLLRKDKTPECFEKIRISDNEMRELRNVYFNKKA